MEWISVKDRLPDQEDIIVGIMQGRHEQTGDPIVSAEMVQLRVLESNPPAGRIIGIYSMDNTERYRFPGEKEGVSYYYETLAYWMLWDDFIWPEDMKIKPEGTD